MIKVISYLLKELLKKMNKDNVAGTEIICEINDLFKATPPSTLITATSNALFYQQIFTLFKSIRDAIVNKNKNELANIIVFFMFRPIISIIFIYLFFAPLIIEIILCLEIIISTNFAIYFNWTNTNFIWTIFLKKCILNSCYYKQIIF